VGYWEIDLQLLWGAYVIPGLYTHQWTHLRPIRPPFLKLGVGNPHAVKTCIANYGQMVSDTMEVCIDTLTAYGNLPAPYPTVPSFNTLPPKLG